MKKLELEVQKNQQKKYIELVILFFSALTIICSITNSSIWIDEGLTWKFTSQGSLAEMFEALFKSAGSEKQMPLYMIYEWLWTKLFGYCEYALRGSNIFFAVIYCVFALKIVKAISKRWYIPYLIFLLNPIFVSYMNEARPYIVMLSMSVALVYYSFYSPNSIGENIFRVGICMLVGFGTHMLFFVSFIIPLTAVITSVMRKEFSIRKYFRSFTIIILLLCAEIFYYGLTFYLSESNSIGNSYGNPLISAAVSVFYILGYGGLFLSRNDLRSMKFSNITWDMIFLTGILTLLLSFICVLVIIFHKNIAIKTHIKCLFVDAALILLFFVFLGKIMHYSFWERHLIEVSALYLCFLCEIFQTIHDKGKLRFLAQIPVLLLFVFFLSSGREIAMNYYGHEDYKGCLKEYGESTVVIGQGEENVFKYYGYNSVGSGQIKSEKKELINITNITQKEFEDTVRNVVKTDTSKCLIVLSKRKSLNQCGIEVNTDTFPEKNVVAVEEYAGLEVYLVE